MDAVAVLVHVKFSSARGLSYVRPSGQKGDLKEQDKSQNHRFLRLWRKLSRSLKKERNILAASWVDVWKRRTQKSGILARVCAE